MKSVSVCLNKKIYCVFRLFLYVFENENVTDILLISLLVLLNYRNLCISCILVQDLEHFLDMQYLFWFFLLFTFFQRRNTKWNQTKKKQFSRDGCLIFLDMPISFIIIYDWNTWDLFLVFFSSKTHLLNTYLDKYEEKEISSKRNYIDGYLFEKFTQMPLMQKKNYWKY